MKLNTIEVYLMCFGTGWTRVVLPYNLTSSVYTKGDLEIRQHCHNGVYSPIYIWDRTLHLNSSSCGTINKQWSVELGPTAAKRLPPNVKFWDIFPIA